MTKKKKGQISLSLALVGQLSYRLFSSLQGAKEQQFAKN
jgi:hypothetical protein